MACLLIAPGIARGAAAADRPNVVLILTDDQGWFEVGVNGNPHIDTPNLDRLAREGARFNRFYAEPVCTPTRACLMTGRHYQRTGAVDTYLGRDTLRADETTLAEVLRSGGYRTGLFGKWHLGRYARYHPNRRGFDEFLGFWQYGFINRYIHPDELFRGREPVRAVGYVTDVLTDAAIGFLRSRDERPFFLELAYNAPHSPHLVPDPYIDRYLKRGLPLRDARIYGMISSLDDNIGRLLKAIDDQGLRQNTLVLFLTDNGGVSQYFKAGLRGYKGSVYEGGIRVPFFARWPGRIPAGATIEAMGQDIDVLPTLCEAVGVSPPAGRKLDGRSLWPLLKAGGGPSPHHYLFRQWTRTRPDLNKNWAVSDGRLKLVNGALYNLQADPGESHDLADELPGRVRLLRSAFVEWFTDVTAGQDYGRVPIEVGRDDEDPIEIDVTWADLSGRSARLVLHDYIRDAIAFDVGADNDASARWSIDVVRPGRYEVTLDYGAERGNGSAVLLRAGDSTLGARLDPGLGPDIFQSRTVGAIDLLQGPATLEFRTGAMKAAAALRLHKVRLRRLPR